MACQAQRWMDATPDAVCTVEADPLPSGEVCLKAVTASAITTRVVQLNITLSNNDIFMSSLPPHLIASNPHTRLTVSL